MNVIQAISYCLYKLPLKNLSFPNFSITRRKFYQNHALKLKIFVLKNFFMEIKSYMVAN